ncbi:hypothetical protein EC991_010536 [Linnemannia zychae]|nr:hypothetical protein EC991_010536 [Linnemannia zychae]
MNNSTSKAASAHGVKQQRTHPYARPSTTGTSARQSPSPSPVLLQSAGSLSKQPLTTTASKQAETVPVSDLVQFARNAFAQKDFAASLQFLTRALSVVPKDINLLDSRAACLEKLGQLEKALEDAKAMIRTFPQNPKGYLRAGKTLRLQQNVKAATKLYVAGVERCSKGSKDYETLEQMASKMNEKLEEMIKRETRVLDPMDRLPFELIMAVFDSLTFTERVRCLTISKKWMTYLGSVRHFWQSIDLAKRVPTATHLPAYAMFLPAQPDQEPNNKVTNKTVLQLVKYAPPKALWLGCAHQITSGLLSQLGRIKRAASIETLSLRMNSKIYEQEFSQFWSLTPRLRVLDLHGCFGVMDGAVVSVIERCPNLEELDISDCRITEVCVMKNCTVPLPNMKKLVIGRWESAFSKEGIDAMVVRFPNLVTLDIRTMRPKGIEALEDLSKLKQLKHLYTDSIETSSEEATNWVVQRWVEGIPHLESLQIPACKGVSDLTIQLIAAGPGEPGSNRRGWSSSLRMLDLKFAGYMSVTDKVFHTIKDHCPKVQFVNLSSCGKLTGLGLMALVNNRGRGLERVCVDNCKQVSESSENSTVQTAPENNNTPPASAATLLAQTPADTSKHDSSTNGTPNDNDNKQLRPSIDDDLQQQHRQQATTSDNSTSMPATDITHIVYPPPSQSDSQATYSPPSPVSTNPFRRSPSVSPSLSATPSLTNRPPLQLPDEDPFSLSAVAAALDPVAVTHSSLTTATSSTTSPATQDPTLSSVPPELPPPPAYTPTASVLDDRASGSSGVGASDATSVATLSPVPSVNTSAPTVEAPVTSTTAATTAATTTTALGTTQSRTSLSRESEPVNQYVLKPIDWIDPATGIEKRIKIITQNENGPCPLLALCNTLILQGKVAIRPYDRPTIGYDHLLELLADYLLHEEPSDVSAAPQRVGEHVETEKAKSRLEIESALRLLPHLEHGLDVNVFFKSIRGFEPTAELGLFHTFGVELVHGWVVSPVIDTPMYALVDGPAGITSYNKAVECIVSGDDAGGGLVVEDLSGNITPILPSNQTSQRTRTTTSGSETMSKDEKIRQALVVQEFMNTTKTQLTHYGLHVLQESLPEGHLCAFFRNNHFCTLFKNPMDGTLYTLVTDQSLAHELSIVWESLVDIDGAGDFLDGLFRQGALEVGDYARNNQPLDSHPTLGDGGGDEDFALALQLQQQEEEEEARRLQKSKSRTSQQLGNNNSNNNSSSSSSSRPSQQHGNYRLSQINGSSNGGAFLSLQDQMYETDEQMAARLHQEYLASSQQQLQQQQQQQQQQQYRQQQDQVQQQYMFQSLKNTHQYPTQYQHNPNGVPQNVFGQSPSLQYQQQYPQQQYPGHQQQQLPVLHQQPAQQHPQLQQQQQQQQQQRPQQPQQNTQSTAPGQGHNRQRIPSDSSSRKGKEKCIIQ